MKWVVQVEAQAPAAAPDLVRPEKLTEFFASMLAVHDGAASGDQRHWAARVVIPEQEPVYPVHTAEQAGFLGEKLVADAARAVGLPDWPIVRVDVVPELLGVQETAAALGISRQRLHELRRSRRFPVPLAELGTGPVWSGSAVRSFLARWQRLPGPRPAGTATYVAADGTKHHFIAAAGEKTGTVWVPVWLAATESQLRWIQELGLTSSPRDGTNRQAVFRVPRWEWTRRITEAGNAQDSPAR
jgi:hypothetical protein